MVDMEETFTKRSPLRTCEACGKKFRNSTGNSENYCNKCFTAMEKENEEADKVRA